MIPCPHCNCHIADLERTCPHCQGVVRTDGILPKSAAAVLLGLAVACTGEEKPGSSSVELHYGITWTYETPTETGLSGETGHTGTPSTGDTGTTDTSSTGDTARIDQPLYGVSSTTP